MRLGRRRLGLILLFLGVTGAVAGLVVSGRRQRQQSARHSRAHAQQLLRARDWMRAVAALQTLLRRGPQPRDVELDLVYALERAGRGAEAARYLQAHPRLWRGRELSAADRRRREAPLPRQNPYDIEDEPDRISPAERAQMLATAERLIARAAVETSLHAKRCEVCHHRSPPLASPAVFAALFPDRELLSEAVTLFTLVRGFSSGDEAARLQYLIGRAEWQLAGLFPSQHVESRRYLRQALDSLSCALARARAGGRARPPVAWREDARTLQQQAVARLREEPGGAPAGE